MIPAPPRPTPGRLAWRVSLAGAVLLVGCSSRLDDGAAITADDQRQLNEAAAVIDANTADPAAAAAHESSPHD